ncbi:RING finger protein 151-like [Haemaphysalis longicornis]
MAAGRTLTAFGFDCGLDWRPTVFVDGMSSNRVCDACGLVPSTAAMLSCRHVLCQPCYDRTIASDGRCCLDGVAIECDDVVWSTFTTESLLRRKIHCWNAPAGCSASGPAREILDHFSRECEYHAVTCSRCDSSVAHTDVVGHISSGSCAKADTDERTTSHNGHPKVNQITSVLGRLEQKVSRLQASLEGHLKRMADVMQQAAETPHPDLHLIESNQCLRTRSERARNSTEKPSPKLEKLMLCYRTN